MKKVMFAVCAAVLAAGCCCLCGKSSPEVTAVSPDGRNEIRLWTSPLAYEVARDGVVVVAKTEIGLKVDGGCLKGGASCTVTEKTLSGCLDTPVYKKAKVCLAGRETFADFGTWAVRLAARDDGVAYRFETKLPGRITVNCEKAALTIPCAKARCSLNYGYRYGHEETVPVSCAAGEIVTGVNEREQYVYLPFVYSVRGKHVAVVESDVCDYPVWNLRRVDADEGVAFGSDFARWPTAVQNDSKVAKTAGAKRERHWNVTARADYLVETDGTRTFPWRAFVLADAPSTFCEADLIYALAREGTSRDFSWVKPGKVAWEWWNEWENRGRKDGCNTAMYKRFIDFAAAHGIEYVIMDEGWSEKLNIWKFAEDVDVPEIIRYGREKGVGIILWLAWAQAIGDETRVVEHFAKLGAVGFKVDFIDRGDAEAERFVWTFAEACAKAKMLVDYHGVHRPTGLCRAYPNVLNYEAVHGLECMKFTSTKEFTDNDVAQFFLRMTAGAMDYTPGAMDNYPVGTYKQPRTNAGSVGTRCHQMAMMAAYEAPLQMLCDAPYKYEKNLECFSFMAKVPVVWAKTVGLGGCPESYAAVARQAKDGAWYAAGINSNTARDFVLDTAFLGAGEWMAEIFRDAPDADKKPTGYVHETSRKVRAGETLDLPMAVGGGFIVKFVRERTEKNREVK